MNICLKTLAAKAKPVELQVELLDRLPWYLNKAVQLNCIIQSRAQKDYYILTLSTEGLLEIICQRCLQIFTYPYHNEIEIAACLNDDTAEKMMSEYDSVVIKGNTIDLTGLLIDELYLFSPEKHETIELCDQEIRKFMNSANQ